MSDNSRHDRPIDRRHHVDSLLVASLVDDGPLAWDQLAREVWLRIRKALTPDQWTEFEALTVVNLELQVAYPEAERLWTAPLADDASTRQGRRAQRDAPLRPMPLAVLSRGVPFSAPNPDWPGERMEGIMLALQVDLARLVPNARHVIATESGHDVHQDQPDLVIAAIRQVVEAVRDPSTWATGAAAPPAHGAPSHLLPHGLASLTSRPTCRMIDVRRLT